MGVPQIHRAEKGATWRIEAEQRIEAENAEAEEEIHAKRVKLLGLQTARGVKENFGINVDFSLMATIVRAGFVQAKSPKPVKLEREVKAALCHARDDRERMEQLNLFLKSVLKHGVPACGAEMFTGPCPLPPLAPIPHPPPRRSPHCVAPTWNPRARRAVALCAPVHTARAQGEAMTWRALLEGAGPVYSAAHCL